MGVGSWQFFVSNLSNMAINSDLGMNTFLFRNLCLTTTLERKRIRPRKTNMTMENKPFEDVSPMTNGCFSIIILGYRGEKTSINLNPPLRLPSFIIPSVFLMQDTLYLPACRHPQTHPKTLAEPKKFRCDSRMCPPAFLRGYHSRKLTGWDP